MARGRAGTGAFGRRKAGRRGEAPAARAPIGPPAPRHARRHLGLAILAAVVLAAIVGAGPCRSETPAPGDAIGEQALIHVAGQDFYASVDDLSEGRYSFDAWKNPRTCPFVPGVLRYRYELKASGKDFELIRVRQITKAGDKEGRTPIATLAYRGKKARDGISFRTYATKGAGRGRGLSVDIAQPGYLLYLYPCIQPNEVVNHAALEPGRLRLLVKPSEIEPLVAEMKARNIGLTHTPRALDDLKEGPIKNVYEAQGLKEGEEAKLASELLARGMIYDHRRLARTSAELPRADQGGWYGSIGGKAFYVSVDRCSEVAELKQFDPEKEAEPGSSECLLWADDPARYHLSFFKGGSSHVIDLRKSYEIRDEIPVAKLEGRSSDGELGDVVLFNDAGSDKRKIIDAEPGAYEDGSLEVLVRPSQAQQAGKWLSDHDMITHWPAFDAGNMYRVEVASGAEYEMMALIREQPWALDVQREEVGKGGPPTYIYFPKDATYGKVEDQQALLARLRSYVRHAFPMSRVRDDDFTVEGRGMVYDLRIKAPMKSFGSSAFDDYWIRTKLVFRFNKTANGDGVIRDTLTFEMPDSFLGKWDRDDQAPPDGHLDHLSPEGDGRYKNLSAADWLQEKMTQSFLRDWNGVLE